MGLACAIEVEFDGFVFRNRWPLELCESHRGYAPRAKLGRSYLVDEPFHLITDFPFFFKRTPVPLLVRRTAKSLITSTKLNAVVTGRFSVFNLIALKSTIDRTASFCQRYSYDEINVSGLFTARQLTILKQHSLIIQHPLGRCVSKYLRVRWLHDRDFAGLGFQAILETLKKALACTEAPNKDDSLSFVGSSLSHCSRRRGTFVVKPASLTFSL